MASSQPRNSGNSAAPPLSTWLLSRRFAPASKVTSSSPRLRGAPVESASTQAQRLLDLLRRDAFRIEFVDLLLQGRRKCPPPLHLNPLALPLPKTLLDTIPRDNELLVWRGFIKL